MMFLLPLRPKASVSGSGCNPAALRPAPLGLAPLVLVSFKSSFLLLFLSSAVFSKFSASCDMPWVFIWFRLVFITCCASSKPGRRLAGASSVFPSVGSLPTNLIVNT